MTVLRVNHVNVSVLDMDAAITFWRDGLGMSLTGRGIVEYDHLDAIVGMSDTTIEWAELDVGDGTLVELFRYQHPHGTPVDPTVTNPGTTHFAFEVDDLDTVTARLVSFGVPTASTAPVTIPFGDWAG
ncbi:MAG: VOC family protein, partial [Propionibacteriales bacterium]|nr:VOC family protein [Propionibacteriales bacterium]